MPDDSKRVDEYIAQAPEFAQPILEKIRKAFHQGCPEVEEAIKWGCPHFMYHGMLGGMAAFKEHVGLGFWKSKQMDDPEHLFDSGTGKKASMCNARFHSVRDVPRQSVLVAYVKQAVRLNEQVVAKTPRQTARKKTSASPPADLLALLNRNRKAKATFESFAASHQRDYIEWIKSAKQPATRQKRLATTIEWLAEGKQRHWKYQSKK